MIPLEAHKQVMRESERITENWQSKLANLADAPSLSTTTKI